MLVPDREPDLILPQCSKNGSTVRSVSMWVFDNIFRVEENAYTSGISSSVLSSRYTKSTLEYIKACSVACDCKTLCQRTLVAKNFLDEIENILLGEG